MTVFRGADRLSGTVNGMSRNVSQFATRTNRSMSNVTRRLSSTTGALDQSVQKSAVVAAVASAGVANVFKTGAEFDQSITSAAARFPSKIEQGTKAFKELSDAARGVGRDTEFTATQAAVALDFLAKSGFDYKSAILALPRIVNLATAANMKLPEASDISTDMLGQFGLNSDDPVQKSLNLARIIDVITKSAGSANATIREMFETFKDVGLVGTMAGLSLETVAAMVLVLADASLKGGRAGTSLKGVLVRLQTPTPEAGEILADLGVRVANEETGDMRDPAEILRDLRDAVSGYGGIERTAALKPIFGMIALQGGLALVNEGTKEGAKGIDGYRESLLAAGGTVEWLSGVLRDTPQGDLDGAISALQSVKITVFKANRVAIRDNVQGFRDWVRGIDAVLVANGDFTRSLSTDVATTLWAVTKAVGVLIVASIIARVVTIAWRASVIAFNVVMWLATTAVSLHTKALVWQATALRRARIAVLLFSLALSLNPIMFVVLAISALILIGVLLYTQWDKISAFFGKMWGWLSDAFSTGIDIIMGALQPFIDALTGVWTIWSKITGHQAKAELKITQTSVDLRGGVGMNTLPNVSIPKPEPKPEWAAPPKSKSKSVDQRGGHGANSAAVSGGQAAGPRGPQHAPVPPRVEVVLRNETNSVVDVRSVQGPMDIELVSSGAFA